MCCYILTDQSVCCKWHQRVTDYILNTSIIQCWVLALPFVCETLFYCLMLRFNIRNLKLKSFFSNISCCWFHWIYLHNIKLDHFWQTNFRWKKIKAQWRVTQILCKLKLIYRMRCSICRWKTCLISFFYHCNNTFLRTNAFQITCIIKSHATRFGKKKGNSNDNYNRNY